VKLYNFGSFLFCIVCALRRPVVGLLSDFGLKDPYVVEMKAVILSICEDAQIIDISHDIEKFNVHMGAFVLASAVSYFPNGAVYVAVVDPEVGTKRRPIVVETKRSLLVGPDNGLLILATEKDEIKHVHMISNTAFMLPSVSKTFHGRDVFAPVAAYLATGRLPSEAGSEVDDYFIPKYAKPIVEGNALAGEVLHIDDFGNIITNISEKNLDKIGAKQGVSLLVKLERKVLRPRYCSAYDEVDVNELLAVIGGHGFLEIAINRGNAASKLKARVEMNVRIAKV
jgi:S-adenosylmethionine hydrolase